MKKIIQFQSPVTPKSAPADYNSTSHFEKQPHEYHRNLSTQSYSKRSNNYPHRHSHSVNIHFLFLR